MTKIENLKPRDQVEQSKFTYATFFKRIQKLTVNFSKTFCQYSKYANYNINVNKIVDFKKKLFISKGYEL